MCCYVSHMLVALHIPWAVHYASCTWHQHITACSQGSVQAARLPALPARDPAYSQPCLSYQAHTFHSTFHCWPVAGGRGEGDERYGSYDHTHPVPYPLYSQPAITSITHYSAAHGPALSACPHAQHPCLPLPPRPPSPRGRPHACRCSSCAQSWPACPTQPAGRWAGCPASWRWSRSQGGRRRCWPRPRTGWRPRWPRTCGCARTSACAWPHGPPAPPPGCHAPRPAAPGPRRAHATARPACPERAPGLLPQPPW
mmetsp:Transcript_28503/g.72521  ORF Transcript_28503/g.72521 Transcript_28503/m.72521 type:complete len:255 (-) Transcript_28503:508-1272(-)